MIVEQNELAEPLRKCRSRSELLQREMEQNSHLCERSRAEWIKRFVEWKNIWRKCSDPEQSTISNNYTGDDYICAVDRCVSLLTKQDRLGDGLWNENCDFMLDVNSQVDPIAGLTFFEDPSAYASEGDEWEVSRYAELYRKLEVTSNTSPRASTESKPPGR